MTNILGSSIVIGLSIWPNLAIVTVVDAVEIMGPRLNCSGLPLSNHDLEFVDEGIKLHCLHRRVT